MVSLKGTRALGYGLPGPFYPIFEIKEVFCDDCHMSNTDIAGKRRGGIEANFAKIYRIIELYILGASGSDSLISLQAPQWNLSQLSYSSKFLG